MEDFMLNMHMQRTTLFDTFYENLQSTAKKGPALSRLLYAARTKEKETTKQRVAAYHEEILKKATGNMNKVSGFLTVYPTGCYCCVEAETPHLMALLKAFQSSALNPGACLEGFCVFSYTEEIQNRAFPSWMIVFVNVQSPAAAAAAAPPAEAAPEEDFPDKWNTEVSELNINMLKWGRQLSEMDKNSQTLALESLRATAEDLLPYDPTVLMNVMDSPRAPKLDEILAILGQHMTIVFDYAFGPSRINRSICSKIVADFTDYCRLKMSRREQELQLCSVATRSWNYKLLRKADNLVIICPNLAKLTTLYCRIAMTTT